MRRANVRYVAVLTIQTGFDSNVNNQTDFDYVTDFGLWNRMRTFLFFFVPSIPEDLLLFSLGDVSRRRFTMSVHLTFAYLVLQSDRFGRV